MAGEISGDMHAADLIKKLKAITPFELELFGIGGEALRAQGVKTLYDVSQTGVVGFIEVIKRLRFFKQMFREIIKLIEEKKPDMLLLVDYPGFNLRLAKAAKKKFGLKSLYYISPQVWAWRSARRFDMARYIDRLLTIFPFEPAFFKDTSLKTDFVGHPLVEKFRELRLKPQSELLWPSEKPQNNLVRIAILPGSREDEIKKNLPVMIESAILLKQSHKNASFLIAAANETTLKIIQELIAKRDATTKQFISVVSGKTREVLLHAKAALVASGTATIEAALAKCPMVIIYKVAPLTFLVGKMFVKVPFLGMVNLVAGKLVAPECLQKDATPEKIVQALMPLLDDEDMRRKILDELEKEEKKLAADGAVSAAEMVLKELTVL